MSRNVADISTCTNGMDEEHATSAFKPVAASTEQVTARRRTAVIIAIRLVPELALGVRHSGYAERGDIKLPHQNGVR